MKLHVEEAGAGEPVVLLHSHGLSSRQWRKLIPELVAHGLRAVAVDLAGQGASEPWPEPRPFSIATDIELVGALVAQLGRVHLVGHSYGGLVALHVARAAPSAVTTMTLFDPVAFGVLDPERDRDVLAQLAALELSPSAPHEQWLRAFVEFWSGAGAWDALREDARAEFRRVAWVIREGVRTLMTDHTAGSAYKVDAPTLLITGALTPAPERRVIDRLVEALPNARREIVPGGHLAPVTHAADVNRLVLSSLAAA